MNKSLKIRKLFAISSLFLPLLALALKITNPYVYILMGLIGAINIIFLFLHKPEKRKLILFSCFAILTVVIYLV